MNGVVPLPCSLQVYDVLNFDMIVMLRLPYTPGCAEWISKVRVWERCGIVRGAVGRVKGGPV